MFVEEPKRSQYGRDETAVEHSARPDERLLRDERWRLGREDDEPEVGLPAEPGQLGQGLWLAGQTPDEVDGPPGRRSREPAQT